VSCQCTFIPNRQTYPRIRELCVFVTCESWWQVSQPSECYVLSRLLAKSWLWLPHLKCGVSLDCETTADMCRVCLIIVLLMHNLIDFGRHY